jgi:D-alanyl-D-alanine carboxypeptidase (penicillin-binding protein 5/6)
VDPGSRRRPRAPAVVTSVADTQPREEPPIRRWPGRARSALAGFLLAAVALASTASAPAGRHPVSGPRRAAARIALPPAPPAPTPPPTPFGDTYALEHPAPDLDLHAQSAVLVDLDTLQVLWERDPHARRAPASLTKLMTVLVAMDLATSLDQTVTVPNSVTGLEPDSTLMGLVPGERLSLRDLMYGIFLESGNDAAETLAGAFVPRDRFIQLMNEKAALLGMHDTHFSNPTGLDAPDHYSSAYDLAIAAAAIAIQRPDIMSIAGTRSVVIPAGDGHPEYDMGTLIRLVDVYPGATGLKTGYTDEAGYCLAATATRAGRHLLAVLLHSDTGLTEDAERLLDYGFAIPPSAEPPPPTVDLLTQ